MSNPTLVTVTIDEVEHTLPSRFEVCGLCEGRGTSCAHVECDGGGFTSSEWAEQDEEFREDYLAGRYDRPCPSCKGLRVVSVIDEDRCDAGLLAAYREEQEDEAAYQAECAAERRMGC
jgi:RecJ-like exonuclease